MFLLLGAEKAQILLHFSIHNFGLTIRLRMMRGGELRDDSKSLAKVLHDLRGKLWTAIRDDGAGKSIVLPDMKEIKFCGVQSHGGLIAWDKLCFFGETVNHGKDRVKSVGKGKISDEVCANVHPRHCAWLKWDSGTGRLRIASFEAGTPITA